MGFHFARQKTKYRVKVSTCFLFCSLLVAVTLLAFVFGRAYRKLGIENTASHVSFGVGNGISLSVKQRNLKSFWQMILQPSRRVRNNNGEVTHFPESDQLYHIFEEQRRIRIQRYNHSVSKRSTLHCFDHVGDSNQHHSLQYRSIAEALVHPAMLSHTHPKRIALIGQDQNGAALSEVLKHRTVQHVTMISQKGKAESAKLQKCYNEPEKCTDLCNGFSWSPDDDPRVEQHNADAASWFIDRYSDTGKCKAEKYDVIILESGVIDRLVKGEVHCATRLVEVVSKALGKDGIFVAHTYSDVPGRDVDSHGCAYEIIEELQEAEFEYLTEYSEARFGLPGTHNFVIAFMDEVGQQHWRLNQAEIDLSISKRIVSTTSKKTAMDYFDGATMVTYQYPSRLAEERFCRSSNPAPILCDQGHGFDPERSTIPVGDLTVKPSTIPNAGRGLFATKSFPEGSYLATEEEVHNILLMPLTTELVDDMVDFDDTVPSRILLDYMSAYGFSNYFYGTPSWSVDAGILTFMNHGCNGTYNINAKVRVTEMNAGTETIPVDSDPSEISVYNPFLDRNHLVYMHALDLTNEDIAAGTEMLGNYMDYIDYENWKHEVEYLKAQCLGQAVGEVTEYEERNKKEV